MMFLVPIKATIRRTRLLQAVARAVLAVLPVTARARLSRVSDNPYSSVEDENGFIFVHIPKCAGNAVLGSIFGIPSAGHTPIKYYLRMDEARFVRYKKVAVVRHPIARFISAYEFLKAGGMTAIDLEYSRKQLEGFQDINAFVGSLADKGARARAMQWTHFLPQWEFLTIAGELAVDHIFHQENLEAEFPVIRELLSPGSDAELKRINVTPRRTSSPLTLDSKRLLLDVYAKDFELLGYDVNSGY